MAQLEALMRRNFVDYASYAILDRAIPDLRDGLKPVQRRILYTLSQMHDGRYHKVANVIGETMKLHPHGDASIGDALVVLANKEFFIDRQGNFGGVLTGHPAAAARYIECRLTPLALEGLFNDALTETRESYDGRTREPIFLPAKLPVALMLGAEGIAVGMSTRILPHNIVELWEAQVALLSGEEIELHPDFPQGGLADVSQYEDGLGKVEIRARVEAPDEKRVVIREIPFGTTTEGLIASIEAAVQKGRLKVSSISDYTTHRVEIELALPRGVKSSEVIPQLFAYTDCSVSVSSNPVLIDERRPVVLRVTEVLRATTDHLLERLRAELAWERDRCVDRKHWLTLEQIFVEHRVYERLERAATAGALEAEVWEGMRAHETTFVRPMQDEDVTRLLRLEIRRISAYDIERNRSEITALEAQIAEIDAKLADLKGTAIAYVRDLLEKYGDRFPRRTRLTSFDRIDVKDVALASLKLSYDPKTRLFGSAVKGSRFKLTVSEHDLVLGISDDGTYRVMTAPEKVFFSGKLIHCEPFDPDRGFEFTVVYRDAARMVYGKRVKVDRFIRNREYQLIKGKGKVDLLLPDGDEGIASFEFAPAPRQRVKSARFDLTRLELTSVGAKGTRLAAKPVARLKLLARKAKHRAESKPSGAAPGKAQAPKPPGAAKKKAKPQAPKPPSGGKKKSPKKRGGEPPGQTSLF
jgi:topoisomerase-4 subunit A